MQEQDEELMHILPAGLPEENPVYGYAAGRPELDVFIRYSRHGGFIAG